jgi:ABC-type uncharacterized transport system permease subunit
MGWIGNIIGQAGEAVSAVQLPEVETVVSFDEKSIRNTVVIIAIAVVVVTLFVLLLSRGVFKK